MDQGHVGQGQNARIIVRRSQTAATGIKQGAAAATPKIHPPPIHFSRVSAFQSCQNQPSFGFRFSGSGLMLATTLWNRRANHQATV
jgi:hypothetical protein